MESKEFISKALKTEFSPKELSLSKDALVDALTMAVASAYVMDQVKKAIIYGKAIDKKLLVDNMDALIASAVDFEDRMNFESDGTCSGEVVNIRLLHSAIGLFTESGEMLDALLAQVGSGYLDKVNMLEEVGDIDWYKAIAHDELDVSEEITRQTVINKLAKRYPEKFTSDAALNRDLTAEREVLEAGLKC